jgi:hypothetical protein
MIRDGKNTIADTAQYSLSTMDGIVVDMIPAKAMKNITHGRRACFP